MERGRGDRVVSVPPDDSHWPFTILTHLFFPVSSNAGWLVQPCIIAAPPRWRPPLPVRDLLVDKWRWGWCELQGGLEWTRPDAVCSSLNHRFGIVGLAVEHPFTRKMSLSRGHAERFSGLNHVVIFGLKIHEPRGLLLFTIKRSVSHDSGGSSHDELPPDRSPFRDGLRLIMIS